MKASPMILTAALCSLFVSGYALTIPNPSFESPNTPGSNGDQDVPDWFDEGGASGGLGSGGDLVQWEGASGDIPDTPFGEDWLNLVDNPSFGGNVPRAVYANIGTNNGAPAYSLSALFGRRGDFLFTSVTFELFSGNTSGADDGVTLASLGGLTLLDSATTTFDLDPLETMMDSFSLNGGGVVGDDLWLRISGTSVVSEIPVAQNLVDNLSLVAVPEPSALALLALGLGSLLMIIRRR